MVCHKDLALCLVSVLTAYLVAVAQEKINAAKHLIAKLKLTEAPSFENPGAFDKGSIVGSE